MKTNFSHAISFIALIASLSTLLGCVPNYYNLLLAESTYSPTIRAEYIKKAYGSDFFDSALDGCVYSPTNHRSCENTLASSNPTPQTPQSTYYASGYGSFIKVYQ